MSSNSKIPVNFAGAKIITPAADTPDHRRNSIFKQEEYVVDLQGKYHDNFGAGLRLLQVAVTAFYNEERSGDHVSSGIKILNDRLQMCLTHAATAHGVALNDKKDLITEAAHILQQMAELSKMPFKVKLLMDKT